MKVLIGFGGNMLEGVDGAHTSRTHSVAYGRQFHRGRESSRNANGFFGGGEHPLIKGTANAAALVLVFDDDEAEKAIPGGKACAHGIDAGEHAVESEGHVVIFGELEHGEHAFCCLSG